MQNIDSSPPHSRSTPGIGPAPDDATFRRMVDSVRGYAMLLLDEAGIVRYWNAGAALMFGHASEHIVGRHFSTLLSATAIADGWHDKVVAVARDEGESADDLWCIKRDGMPLLVNVLTTAMEDAGGKLTGFSQVIRDVTVHEEGAETARQSDVNFRLLVEEVKDYAIFMLTPEGRVASWNAGAEAIKGYRAEEIIGQHISRFYEADAAARRWPDHELELARSNGRFEDEGWRLRKDGSRFWANVSITALRDGDGELKGFAKVTRDLTARRQIEELRRSERQTNEFLAMLAHELRNPLSPMRTALDLALRSPESPTLGSFALDVFSRQLTHLTRLVDDLLDVSRITRGKIAVKLSVCDLNQVLRDTVAAMRPLASDRGQMLELRLPDTPTLAKADPTRIAQVVSNLLSNAIKYTPGGGHILLVLTQSGDMAMLRVRDDGVGMSESLLPRVFDLFVQGDRELDRREGGLGIGLTLVRRLVEMHGGTVTASSAGAGKGSEFSVRLPIVAPPAVSAPLPAPVHEAVPRLKVLVVDDNLDVATSMAMLLDVLGHTVRTAGDGEQTLAIAAEMLPDLVLLDIGLPRMNGYEVARALRQMAPLAHMTIVACTGYGRDEDRQLAENARFDLHAVKPVGADKLIEILGVAAKRRNG